jgi:hypothetical protein
MQRVGLKELESKEQNREDEGHKVETVSWEKKKI